MIMCGTHTSPIVQTANRASLAMRLTGTRWRRMMITQTSNRSKTPLSATSKAPPVNE